MNDKRLKEILDFDPLSQAERISGNSYKEDEDTMKLGFLMNMIHGENKENTLKSLDDTTFSNKLNNYIRIIESEGFQKIYELEFYSNSSNKNEKMFIYFHQENGILLKFDTYNQTSVNGGNFYYNWKPFDMEHPWSCTSSGGFEKNKTGELIWCGYHDCREALRFHIRQLKNNGQFITPWIKVPFYWLLHHEDKGDNYPFNNYERITQERISYFPQWVKEIMGA